MFRRALLLTAIALFISAGPVFADSSVNLPLLDWYYNAPANPATSYHQTNPILFGTSYPSTYTESFAQFDLSYLPAEAIITSYVLHVPSNINNVLFKDCSTNMFAQFSFTWNEETTHSYYECYYPLGYGNQSYTGTGNESTINDLFTHNFFTLVDLSDGDQTANPSDIYMTVTYSGPTPTPTSTPTPTPTPLPPTPTPGGFVELGPQTMQVYAENQLWLYVGVALIIVGVFGAWGWYIFKKD